MKIKEVLRGFSLLRKINTKIRNTISKPYTKNIEGKNNFVIISRSVVTKQNNNESVIIGGTPAKIIKDNITWERERI